MRGSAVAEGIVHGGELLLHVLLAQTYHLESLYHYLRVVVTHGAGAELHAVAHQVVLVGSDAQGVYLPTLCLQQHIQAAGGHGEGIVAELQLAALLAYLVHWEVHYPAELVALLVHMVGAGGAQHLAHDAGGLLSGLLAACGHANQAARLQLQSIDNLLLAVGKELGNASRQLAVFVQLEPVGLEACLDFHVGTELVYILTSQGAVADHYGLDGAAFGKGGKVHALDQSCDILNGEVYAQIRFVGAVLVHSLQIGDTAEGSGGGYVVGAELGKDGRQHIFQNCKHVVLVGKGHLHIQLIELAGGAVASGVLVTEAGGYLEIAVKACGHQQLLELLGSLRQGIELAGVLPGGHQVVSGSLGRGGGEYGGGYL